MPAADAALSSPLLRRAACRGTRSSTRCCRAGRCLWAWPRATGRRPTACSPASCCRARSRGGAGPAQTSHIPPQNLRQICPCQGCSSPELFWGMRVSGQRAAAAHALRALQRAVAGAAPVSKLRQLTEPAGLPSPGAIAPQASAPAPAQAPAAGSGTPVLPGVPLPAAAPAPAPAASPAAAPASAGVATPVVPVPNPLQPGGVPGSAAAGPASGAAAPVTPVPNPLQPGGVPGSAAAAPAAAPAQVWLT